MTDAWAGELARSLLAAHRGVVPDDVLERAALQTLDAIACAAGAQGAGLVEITRAVTHGSGPAEASVFFTGERVNVLDAVLVNGTAVRYLDLNDAFIGAGTGGHPSDNIVAALAVGEQVGASGRDVLSAIALGYEVFWRFRQRVYARTPAGAPWDGVSVSGLVSAAMTGLLLNLDEARLTHALAIGSATGYALKQLRRGSISMMKGCANSLVARDGVMAARLAAHGVTGPEEIFEGKSGLLHAFGLEATPELLAELVAEPTWAIRGISIKPYPAIATAQAAIHAAVLIARRGLDVDDVGSVDVRLPDSKSTREHLEIEQRQRPRSRESADHSVPFLIACALTDRELTLRQFEDERWLDPRTTALMARVRVVPDAALVEAGQRCYPAVMQVVLRDGRVLEESVSATPGSPDAPWGFDDIAHKLAEVQQVGLDQPAIERIRDAARGLPQAPDLGALVAALTQTPDPQ